MAIFGIASLITIENLFPPIPSEVILTFGGFLTKRTSLSILGVIIASTVGSVLGAIILYMLGRLLCKERLYKIVNGKIGRCLHFKIKDIDSSEKWFLSKGKYSIFFCRFIPIVRSLISIPAGMTKMNITFFLVFTTLGSIIWNTVLIILGSIAGEAWTKISESASIFSKGTKLLLVSAFLICIIMYLKSKNKKLANK